MTDQRSPAQDALRWIADTLKEYAEEADLPFREAPELASSVFRGAKDTGAASIASRDLPFSCGGLEIGRYHVLFGLLPEAPREEDILETLRLFRNQCVVARSYIAPNAALDLQLFLIGPRGSEIAEPWHPLALLIEREERVARKLVWLRPDHANNDTKSFADFTKRSFLARPWKHDARFSMATLDNISQAAPDEDIPRTTAGEWVKLAAEHRGDPAALVDGLVRSWEKRGTS
ncbi:ABC-three component system middle component 1 [Rhizobium ruizarguesonis]|jgi:hypothetical protein